MHDPLFAIALNTTTIIILLIVGILLFGRRLPEVGKTLAKGIREFQNGMRGVEDEVTGSIREDRPVAPEPPRARPPQRLTESAPKFVEADPPPQAMAEPAPKPGQSDSSAAPPII
jgi:sec-independent protein translocase protein TatA